MRSWKHGITDVDLLSLDVEGFELQALRGLAACLPKFVLVEARERAAIQEHLRPNYELVAELSHHDHLFRRRAQSA